MRLPSFCGPGVAAASALLLASGCALDLELPSAPRSPTVTGFAPAAAFGGQLIRVSGSQFERDAAANTVNFVNASARGERFEGADLVVRVPANAGDGPITVSSREGTSAASGAPFDYLGLGEPGRLQVASESPILHQPRAIYPLAGDVALDSTLYGGLVFAGNGGASTPTIVRSASDVSTGMVYYVVDDLLAGLQLVAIDAAKGSETGRVFLLDVPHQLLPMTGRNLVLVFSTNGLGQEQVAGWSGADLSPVFGSTAYGVGSFDGAVEDRAGHAVVAGYDALFERFTLFLLDVTGAPSAPGAAVEFTCDAGYAGPCPPPLGTGSSSRVPLAAANSGGGGGRVIAALDDGNAVIATLAASPPRFLRDVETFSPAPIESLAGASLLPTVVGTKPAAGYAFAFDADGGNLRWIVDANTPTVLGILPQPSPIESTDLAFVGGAADNDVLVVNVKTGLKVGRVNFDVGPRAAGWAGAAAFLPASSGLDGDLVFPVEAFPGLLRVPIGGAGAPSVLSRVPGTAMLAATDAGALWRIVDGASPTLEAFLGYSGGSWSTALSIALEGTPQRVAATELLAVVGHDGGLSLVDGSAPPPGPAPTAPIPGASIWSPSFLELGFTRGGRVWTLVEVDAGAEVQLWTPAAIAGGQAPAASWAVPGTALAAAMLEEGLWVFHLDAALDPVATLLDEADLAEVRTVPIGARLTAIHALSPNGRLLVLRESGGALGFVLRFFRADPAAGFPEVGSLVFSERIEAFTFDATGERLYVLTQNPDRVITVD